MEIATFTPISAAPPVFVRLPRTGDELAQWREQSRLSIAKAAKATGYAYNTFKEYERRGWRKIPKACSLACAAIDAGVTA